MRTFLIISSIAMTVFILTAIIKDGVTMMGIVGIVLFGGASLNFLFQDRLNDWITRRRKRKIESAFCILKKEYIHFPKGYYFNFGYLNNGKNLPYSLIDEIRINTHPISAKINGNEIIFLCGLTKEKCEEISRNFTIPLAKPQDNWSLICDEFLDTEFDESIKERTLKLLEDSGISRIETKNIRNRIAKKMILRTFSTWEWVYYGQFDVLSELWPLNEKKYWWTMDIALRKK